MRIAVASKGLEVSPRFEHCESYMCYTVDHGIITDCQNMPNLRFSVADTVDLMRALGVTTLICGAIHIDVARVFRSEDIEVVAGASGHAQTVVRQYLTRTLIGVDEMCHGDDDSLDGAGCALSEHTAG